MSKLALDPINVLSSASAPTLPALRAGDLYYNTSSGLQVYSGSDWSSVSGATQLIFTGFDGGTASTTIYDLTLDLGAA